jgi:hypothetical protein
VVSQILVEEPAHEVDVVELGLLAQAVELSSLLQGVSAL